MPYLQPAPSSDSIAAAASQVRRGCSAAPFHQSQLQRGVNQNTPTTPPAVLCGFTVFRSNIAPTPYCHFSLVCPQPASSATSTIAVAPPSKLLCIPAARFYETSLIAVF